ncbi:hypothetical protein [Alkalihalobacillus sp. CinArs1]|uniref:hypothetical protein n=1 Tax=Alkalihalobacillus sp. CinArs1 TaxID=2995314 RepID=UPI0022DE9421|nr:hypothetical protein [Alkalihalobacillus sp. CinArs1]
MALAIAMTISLFLIQLTIFHRKMRSFLENSIVFFGVSIFIMNYLTIITWNMKFISTSDDNTLFLTFLLHRNLITPLIIILFINTVSMLTSRKAKFGFFACTLLIMHTFNLGSVYLKVEVYNEWNFFLAIMMDCILLLIGLAMLKFVMMLGRREHYEGL